MPPAPRDWRVDVLRSIGAPVTKANLAFLAAWQRQEGGHTNNRARFNWLNTTNGKQFPSINSVGVRSYPDYATGIRQTAATLDNGKYRNIVAGLRSGNPVDTTLLPAVSGDLQTWVSGRRTGNPEYVKRVFTGTAQRAPGGGGIGGFAKDALGFATDPRNVLMPGGVGAATVREGFNALPGLPDVPGLSSVPVVGGALDAAGDAISAPIDAAKAVIGGFQWIFGNWDRIFFVLGGFIILIIGLVLLARSMASRPDKITVGLAGDLANRVQYGPAKERTPAVRDRSLSRKQSVTLPGDQPAPRTANAGASQDAGGVPF